MVYIPYNELENIVDLTTYGNVTAIKKVTLNNYIGPKADQPRQLLNRLSNFTHSTFHTRELHLYNAQILNLLRDFHEREILTADARSHEILNNKVEITYLTNGMTHKMRLDLDKDWELHDEGEGRKSIKAGARILSQYKNVVSLQNSPTIFGRNEFIKVMQKLPLLNYLCSLEHTEIANTLTKLNNIKFSVRFSRRAFLLIWHRL